VSGHVGSGEPSPSDTEVTLKLGRAQLSALRSVLGQVGEIGSVEEDAAARRLLPPASTERTVADEFAEMTERELRSRHVADELTLDAVLERGSDDQLTMTSEEADACVRAVGAARIALAARLGMYDDGAKRFGFRQRAAVDFLGYIQDQLVTALMAHMPDAGNNHGNMEKG